MRNSPMDSGYLSIVEEEALHFGARGKVIVHASQGVVVECEHAQVGHACVSSLRPHTLVALSSLRPHTLVALSTWGETRTHLPAFQYLYFVLVKQVN